MLQPLLESLNRKSIILASGSPRRKEILTALGVKYTSVPSLFEENLDKSSFSGPSEYAKETAKQKAMEVFNRIQQTKTSHTDLVIAVDTVVFLGDKIIEKPKDEHNAFAILKSLSGKTHTVHSGVTLLRPATGGEKYSIHQFDEITKVTFGTLTDEIIKMYVDTKEPLDKAGGYGIQSSGLGGSLVKCISGDYFNVIGFPLHRFCVEMITLFGEKV